ncbi:MAG: hypothetical protein ABI867_21550 [Kofleriaceae bacterium]
MKPVILLALVASLLSGCLVRTRGANCHRDCWWEHGHKRCVDRCR